MSNYTIWRRSATDDRRAGVDPEANLTAATLFGATRSALVGEPLSRFIVPEDQDVYLRHRQRLAQMGALHSWDMRMRRADGSTFWAHLDAVLARDGECLCTLCDATERKRPEEAVRVSERRLKEAQRIGKMGSLDWDLATNDIVLSEETLEMYGFDRADAKPTLDDIIRLLPPEEKERVENSMRTAIAGGARHDMEHRIVRPDGREIFVRATAELLRDPDGKPVRLLGTVLDITESKTIENAQAFLRSAAIWTRTRISSGRSRATSPRPSGWITSASTAWRATSTAPGRWPSTLTASSSRTWNTP